MVSVVANSRPRTVPRGQRRRGGAPQKYPKHGGKRILLAKGQHMVVTQNLRLFKVRARTGQKGLGGAIKSGVELPPLEHTD